MEKAIYFIADAHLGFEKDERERTKQARLISFLRYLKDRAERLYIVGDLFDFWFEYESVVPRIGAKVLYELYDLVRSGTEVVYIGGNHDFWIGSFLSDEIGIRIVQEPMDIRHRGLRIYIAHGDGEADGEIGYKMMKGILRSSLCIRLFRLLHPDFGARIARHVSRSSGRRMSKRFPLEARNRRALAIRRAWLRRMRERYERAARVKLEAGFDAVVFGHIHIPICERYGNKVFLIVGDWIRQYTYVVLRHGRFELRRWSGG